MLKCANCGATLSCGCQRKTLPDGKSGCIHCYKKPTTNTSVNVDNTNKLKKFTR